MCSVTAVTTACTTSQEPQCPTGDVALYSQTDVNNFATNYPNCTEISGYLYISGSTITDLSPLSNLTSIGGYLHIDSNSSLTNLDGLSNLTSIGGYLRIYNNSNLTNLDGLSNLTQIGGYLDITYNSQLTNLDGLSNLTSIGADLVINSNYSLTDISGLQNIDPASILSTYGLGLYIMNNSSLSVCNLPNFCTYLQGSGPRTISGNAGDCISEAAVTTACIPACDAPTDVTATDITLESATLNWTSTGTDFDIEWGTADFTQGTGTQDTTTNTSYDLSNLEIGTSYDFYVRQNCSDNESNWVKYTFSTSDYCVPVPEWDSGDLGINIDSFTTTGGETNISNTNSGYSTNGYGNFSATHSVSQIAGEDISFSAVPGTQHWNKGLGIWVDWNNDGVFNNDSSEIVYVSPNVTIGTHNGSFSIPSDKQAGNYRMRVMIKYIYTTMDPCEITYGAPYYEYFYGETEDYTLTVLEVPPCEVPTAVTATDITLESAAINWTSTGNNFDIEWGTAGFTQGQGTTATTTTTSYALSNLTLGTSYDFYVRQNCSLNESDWVKHTFSTNNYCIPVPVANSGYYGVNISSFTTMGGETNISNIDSGFSTNGYGNFSATHSVSQIAGEDISFSAVPGESSLYEKGLRIWVDWNKDGVFNNDNSEIVYIYPNVITGTHNGSFSIPADKIADSYRMRVMIKYSSSNIDPCETNYGNSFYGETEDYTLTVLEVPPCDVPTAVTATDITLESATINWTSTGNNFDIEWGTADFTQGTGTTVTGITANSYSLTSLSSNTQYQFYVRQDCSVNESDWTGPFGFTTLLQCPTGDVTLYSQADVNNFATNYPNCTEITGYLYIGGSNITDLSPLNNIQSVGGYLNIESNSQLTNLDGLSNLTQIGGFLAFQSNDILENLDGLGNLTQIGGYLNIYYNSQLTNLDGLGNLTQIGGNLYITSNSQLTNLDGLSALESINGSLFIYDNPVLTDISGLQNIDPATILSTNGLGLYIQYNPLLSVCNLDNFCTYLAGDGERTISGNLGTCYDVDAVVAACNASVYDCPDLELNIGDTCTDADGNEGTVDEDCNCYVEPTPAVCEWTVHIWDNHWGDDVTWSLKDKEGNVLLQGGYYDLIYDDTQTVTTEGPLTFTISNVGEHNDNIPNYTVFNGTEILVEGQLTQPSMTLEFTDLNCYVAPTCSAEWTGAVSEDWNTAANWCDNTVPTAGSNVVINNSNLAIIDINTVVTIESITLGAAANVTVNGLLNVGDITVAAGGSLVIANDANLLQSETATNTGNITVKRNTVIKHLDYTIWSSPVADQELEAFSPNTLASRIYQYNTSTDAWEVTAENFTAGKGIMFRAPNLFDDGNYPNAYTYEGVFTGTPHNGDISVSFSQVGEYQGVGNPYPSNIKITGADGFWNTNPTVGTLYFWTNTNAWDTGTGDYVANNWATYSNLGGLAAANSTKVPVDIISVGQGFVIKTPGLSSISFNNGMRIAQNSVFFRTIEEDKHRLWLNLSDSSSELNNILIGYMDGATQGEDLRIDSKMFNYNGSALYSLIESNGFAYTIQGRSLPFDDFDVVPLGFRAITPGSFTVSLASFDGLFAQGQDIFLKDNLTQTQHNLKDSDYTFVSNQGEFTTRFEVVYRTSMNVTNPELSNAWTVYAKNKTFFIETQGIDLERSNGLRYVG